MTEAFLFTLAGVLALPLGAGLVAALAFALVSLFEFASLMVFLWLVTEGRKAARP